MTLRISYQSVDFPAHYSLRSGVLQTSWNELLWAAITVGRPSAYHVFRHGPASFHEAIFRFALIRMALEQDGNGNLCRTDAYEALDPTEKGMVSYFLGMAVCKLFAARLLQTPWLLHLDVFRRYLTAVNLGRSRPDLVGQDMKGNWYAFESKGRSSPPSRMDKDKAKAQASRLISVYSKKCSLNIGSFACFRKGILEFYWRDPEPDSRDVITLPEPKEEWRFYFEPAFAFAFAEASASADMAAEREMTDVTIEIHPEVLEYLSQEGWLGAKQQAQQIQKKLASEGYRPDGLKVKAGKSWERRFEPRERG